MLDVELAHRKVLRVPGCKRNANRGCRCGNQAICLCERDSAVGVVASPLASELTFPATDLEDLEPVKQSVRCRAFIGPEPAMDFLDIDRGGAWNTGMLPQRPQALDGAGPTAEHVDQDRRIEENRHAQPTRCASVR